MRIKWGLLARFLVIFGVCGYTNEWTSAQEPEQPAPAPALTETELEAVEGAVYQPLYEEGYSAPTTDNWYFGAEALFMHRSRYRDKRLVTETATNPNTVLGTTDDLDFGYNPGMRFTLGRPISGNRRLEFIFSGVYDQDSRFNAVGMSLNAPFTTGGANALFSDMEGVQIDANTETSQLELNIYRPITERYTLINGLRYMHLRDMFRYTAFNTMAPPNPNRFTQGEFLNETVNDWFGYQIGGNATTVFRNWLELSATVKTGLFATISDLDQRTSVVDNGVDTLINFTSDSETGFGGMIEVGLTATIRITDNFLFRTGYQLQMMSGLALAGNNIGEIQTMENTGVLVFDGATVGFIYLR